MEEIGLVAIFDTKDFNAGLNDYLKGVNKANGATEGAEKSGFKFAHALEVAVGGALLKVGELAVGAAVSFVNFAKDSIGIASEFQGSLIDLQLAAADSGKSVEELGDIAIAVGADSRILGASASGASEAMTNLYKAGLSTEVVLGDVNSFMEDGAPLSGALASAFNLAAASELDVAQAGDLAAITLAQFGRELEDGEAQTQFINQALDNLVKTADASAADVSTLAEALKFVGPTAADAGYSIEDTNNALGILSMAGINGSMAGTTLNAMFNDLTKGTEASTEMLDKLKINLYDVSTGEMLPMVDIIGQFETALAGATQEEKNAALQAIFTTQGRRGMNVLLAEGVEGWEDMEDAVESASGIEQQAAEKSKSFAAQMEALDGQIETLRIQIGTELLPILTTFLTKIIEFAEKYGPEFANVFEVIMETATPFIEWIIEAVETGEIFNEVLSRIPGPVGEFADSLAYAFALVENGRGLLYGFASILDNFLPPEVAENVYNLAQIFQDFFGNIKDSALEVLGPQFEELQKVIAEIDMEKLAEGFETVKKVAGFLATVLIGVLGGAIGAVGAVITGFIGGLLKMAGEVIKVWEGLMDDIKDLFDAFATKDFGKIWKAFKKLFINAWKGLFKSVGKFVEGFVKSIIDYFKVLADKLVGHSIVTDMMDAIQNVIEDVLDKVSKFVDKWIGNIEKFFEDLKTSLEKIWTSLWENIETIASDLIDEIKDTISDAFEKVKDIFEKATDKLKSVWESLWSDIKNRLNSAVEEIKNNFSNFVEQIKLFWITLTDNIKNAWYTMWDRVREGITEKFESIRETLSNAVQSLIDKLSEYWENFKEAGREFARRIADGISEAWSNVTNAIANKLADLKSSLTSVWVKVEAVGKTIVEKITTGLKGAWDIITGAFGDFFQTELGQSISNYASALMDFGKNILEKIKDGIRENIQGFIAWILSKIVGGVSNPDNPNPNPRGPLSNPLNPDWDFDGFDNFNFGQNRSVSPLSGNNISSVNTNNTRNINVEVNASYSNMQSEASVLYDVLAALQATGA